MTSLSNAFCCLSRSQLESPRVITSSAFSIFSCTPAACIFLHLASTAFSATAAIRSACPSSPAATDTVINSRCTPFALSEPPAGTSSLSPSFRLLPLTQISSSAEAVRGSTPRISLMASWSFVLKRASEKASATFSLSVSSTYWTSFLT